MSIFDGVQIDDSTKKVLSEKVTELETSYEKQLKDTISKFDEAVATRQQAKAKVKELEDKIAAGNSDSKELLTSKQKEIEQINSQLEQFKTDALTWQKKYEDYENENKKELLSQIPDGDLKEVAVKLELMDLKKFVAAMKIEEGKKKESSFTFGQPSTQPAKNVAEWRKKASNIFQ